MSDLFTSLAARSLGKADTVRPRVPSLFEPAGPAAEPLFSDRETPVPNRANAGAVTPPREQIEALRDSRAAAPHNLHQLPADPTDEAVSTPASRQAVTDLPQARVKTIPEAAPDPAIAVDPAESKPVTITTEPSSRRSIPAVLPSGMRTMAEAVSASSVPHRDGTLPDLTAAATSSHGATIAEIYPDAPKPAQPSRSASQPTAGPAIDVATQLARLFADEPRTEASPSSPRAASNDRQPASQPSARRSEPLGRATSEPSVQVTIGRVEVRAIFPEAPAQQNAARPAVKTVSLNEYLKGRSRGAR